MSMARSSIRQKLRNIRQAKAVNALSDSEYEKFQKKPKTFKKVVFTKSKQPEKG